MFHGATALARHPIVPGVQLVPYRSASLPHHSPSLVRTRIATDNNHRSFFGNASWGRQPAVRNSSPHLQAATAISMQKAYLKTRVTIKTKNYYGGSSKGRSGDDSDSTDEPTKSWGAWVPLGRQRKRKDSVHSMIDNFAKMIGKDVVLYVMRELTNTPELKNAVKATAKAVVLGIRKQLQSFTDFTLKQIGESTKQQKLDKNSKEQEFEDEDDEEFNAQHRHQNQHHQYTHFGGSSTVNKPNVYDILGVPRKANPRQVLGVSEDATVDEIKQAYHNLAKKWHPDTNTHAHANRVFAKIKKNYGVLMEEIQRTNPSGGNFHV